MIQRKVLLGLLVVGLLGVVPAFAPAQEAESNFKNLQVLPQDIAKTDLKALMDSFTEQLDVKCSFCHVIDEYHKDDMQQKKDARRMMQLVTYMRANVGQYFKDGVEASRITCWQCHRGKAEPDEYLPE